MPGRYTTISFLSDYGLTDEFVGVVKSVIRSLAPEVTVIDITHEVAPHDVRAGALALVRAAQYLCPGVVLAVVDPGVGGERRAVAVEVGDGESVLIGPDNGLLAPAVGMCGGATRAVALTNPDYQLPAPGPTFAGRDVFAPAAAHVCLGVDLSDLGEPIDPGGLQPGVVPLSRLEGDTLLGEVLWVDRFGNAQLNIAPDEVEDWGDRILIGIGDTTRTAVRAASYDALESATIGLVVDSYGLLSVAVDRGSAAEELGLEVGAGVALQRADDNARPQRTAQPTPVTLRDRPGGRR